MKRHTAAPHTGPAPGRGPLSVSARLLLLALALVAALAAVPAVALAAPSVTTAPATKVHHTSAILNGHLDPDVDPGITACSFEWGTTIAYGNTAPCNEGNAFAAPADVSANINNLTPGTTYHFRLHAETNSSGPFNGADQSFRPDTFPITHPEIASFGPDGTSSSSFGELGTIAFNQSARKLFALDRDASGVFGFDASSPPAYTPLANFNPLGVPGPPGDSSDVAVDSTALISAGNVYYVSETNFVLPPEPPEYKIYGYSASATPLPGFPIKTSTGIGCGAAVDSDGHLWVAGRLNTIEEFSSAGAKISSIQTADQGFICKLAFDSNDDMYAVTLNGPVWKYTAASGYTSGVQFAPEINNRNVAVDFSTHNVYIAHFAEPKEGRFPDGWRVDEYDSAGHFLGEFGVGLNDSYVTVDSTNHNAFVASQDKKIHVFDTTDSATFKLPTVTTGQASAITGSTVTISGAVDPEGMLVTNCHIGWGELSKSDDTYENNVPCSPGSGSGDVPVSASISGLTSGTEYHFRVFASSADGTNAGKDVSFTTNFPPAVKGVPPTNVTNDSADLNGLVDPKGFATTYRFEWGTTPAYGNSVPVPDGSVGSGEGDAPVSAHIGGLAPNTRYFWRLTAESLNGSVVTEGASFLTLGAPVVETTGAPMRTTSSAQLGGRVAPRGFATSYFFEYGAQGPCDANPCTATTPQSAGSGEVTELVSEEIEGLEAGATYHYRIVADNGQPGTPVFGGDMTVTTRSSESIPSHGHFFGPPGSDRAYEQVSLPESGGNPVNEAMGFSVDGNRSVYAIAGGTPLSDTGNLYSLYFSQRTETAPHEGGWQQKSILPPRGTEGGSSRWKASPDATLSSMVAGNSNEITKKAEIWRLDPEGPPSKLFTGSLAPYLNGLFRTSDDGSRLIALIGGSQDPAYQASGTNFYDLTPGAPHLANLLPDGSPPPCGVIPELLEATVTADGSRLFFTTQKGTSCGPSRVYARNLGIAETELLSPPPASGPECDAIFLSSAPGAVFLFSKSRLGPEDTEPSSCEDNGLDGDVYRVDLADGTLKCVTCVVPDKDADVYVKFTNGEWRTHTFIAVSEDGSRVYFQAPRALMPGAATTNGEGSLYRVNVKTGDLAWIGGPGVPDDLLRLTPDGTTALLQSNSPFLNPLNGSDNGGTKQTYRYDDRDRSLICLSCPLDGSAAREESLIAGLSQMSDDGEDIAFATTTPLVGADQNTPGPAGEPERGKDVYEWRDGRYFLVTDGLTNTTPKTYGPEVTGISPDGRDLYFIAPVQYTPDALDGYRRLYDARIGGGFLFPPPPPPCPLEVCQGTPKGAPEERAPGTGTFAGPGNLAGPARAKCAKGKARRKGRCVAKKPKRAHNRASQNRRTAR